MSVCFQRVMDTDPLGNDDVLDGGASDDGNTEERRHRRDFLGTELERPKKSSRQRQKKRKRAGLDLTDDSMILESNSNLERDASKRM